jgi:hypothetical protein
LLKWLTASSHVCAEFVPLPPDIVQPRTTVEHLPPVNVIEPEHAFTGVEPEILAKECRQLEYQHAKGEAVILLQQRLKAQIKPIEPDGSGTEEGLMKSALNSCACGAARNVEEGQDTEKQCEVCQVAYKDDDQVMLLPCSHFFHTECISRWLNTNVTCPVCRFQLCEPKPAENIVTIRRTTTIQWMPVLQWIPISSTSVTIRSESNSDVETVTTATTRPTAINVVLFFF